MGDFEVLFFQPSPWGEGGWPLGQTDEGTGFGLPFVERTVQLGFALRGEFLFHVEKEPKDARGSAQDGHSVSIFAAPLEPHYEGRVLVGFCKMSGAQNLSGVS